MLGALTTSQAGQNEGIIRRVKSEKALALQEQAAAAGAPAAGGSGGGSDDSIQQAYVRGARGRLEDMDRLLRLDWVKVGSEMDFCAGGPKLTAPPHLPPAALAGQSQHRAPPFPP
jgi:hypothetical protein